MHWKSLTLSMCMFMLLILVGCAIPETTSGSSPVASQTVSSTSIPTQTISSTMTALPSSTSAVLEFKLPTGSEAGYLKPRMNDPQLRAAFSPVGDILATGHMNGQVALWNISTEEQMRVLKPRHQDMAGAVDTIAFSPDGTMVAASKPGLSRIDIWDVATGELVGSVKGGYGMKAVLFSPSGKLLAGGIPRGQDSSAKGQIFLWDVSSGVVEQTMENAAPPMAFSRDGETLVTVSGDLTVRSIQPGAIVLWNVSTGQEAKIIQLSGFVASIDYDSEHQILAASVVEGSLEHSVGHIYLIDATTGQTLDTLEAHSQDSDQTIPGAPSEIRFSPDYSLLAANYQPNIVAVWDVASREQIRIIEEPINMTIQYPSFSPDGTLLAASSSDGHVIFWKVNP